MRNFFPSPLIRLTQLTNATPISAKIFDDTYLLEHNHVQKRSVDPHDAVHSEVSEHPSVSWAEQQRVLSRQKRQLWRLPPPTLPPPEHYENDLNLNDER